MAALAAGMIVGPSMGVYIIGITKDIGSALVVSIGFLILLFLYSIVLPESCPQVLNPLDKDGSKQSIIGGVEAKALSFTTLVGLAKQTLIDVLDSVLLFLPGRMKPALGAGLLPSKYALVLLVSANTIAEFAAKGKMMFICAR